MIKNRAGNRHRGLGKVSKKMAEMSVIKVTCGNVKGRLHKSKFYCPGIHRECIEYQGRFITPKMFSVMGDKERLKDWKNALRINGIQVRKYIESGALDFNRHDEFCTGRCIARSPVNRGAQDAPQSIIPKVEFVSSINEHTYCHLPDDGEHSGIPNIPTVEMTGDPEPVDVKPNVALLQSLLEKPPACTVDVLPPDVAAALSIDKDECEPISIDPATAEEDRQFWVGIMELGLLEHFFREIKINLDVYKSDLVTHQVRTDDAVRISSVVRSMGLMKKFKKRLASFKSDMDQQQAKIDAEMQALKQQVTQYELRKQALKRKSEKFELLMDMSANKKAFIIEKNVDDSEDEANSDQDDGDNSNEVVDICYEDAEESEEEEAEDDDEEVEEQMDVPKSGVVGKVEYGEKRITVPPSSSSSSVATPVRCVSPVKITTLPSDSTGSYIIKNNPSVKEVTFYTPTSTKSTPAVKPDPAAKVTIIRQVLMDTGNEGDTMEKLKEAAVLKLKESIASKRDVSETHRVVMSSAKVPNTSAVKTTKSVSIAPAVKSTAPAKEKIKIIARCKPVDPSAVCVGSQRDDVVVSSAVASSSPVTQSQTTLTYSPNSQSLSVPQQESTKKEKKEKKDSSVNTESERKDSKSPITKEVKVFVQPVETKKRKPGPKSKTEYFEVNMKLPKEDSPSGIFESSGSQTPTDGVRESLSSLEVKPAISARRSNRKTGHMFAWGMKSGSESQVSVQEDSDTDGQCVVEELSPSKEKFTWDLE